MAIKQFDVFANPARSARSIKPFLLCLQHGSLDQLTTRIVAPLLVEIRGDLTRLNPVFTVNKQRVFLDPANLATLRTEHLRDPVLNLESERHRIIAALDLVFTGI